MLVLDIYAASEAADSRRHRQNCSPIASPQAGGTQATYVGSFPEAAELRRADLRKPGDLVLTLGAGNVSQLGPLVLEALETADQLDSRTIANPPRSVYWSDSSVHRFTLTDFAAIDANQAESCMAWSPLLCRCSQMQYIPVKPAKTLSAPPTKPDIVRRIAEVFGSFTVFMARKTTSTLPEEEFEAVAESRASSRSYDESPLDARMLDLDDEGESPFLRGQKRVPVRRGALPRKAAGRIKLLLLVLLIVGVVGLVGRHSLSLRHAVVALSHRFQRQHRGRRATAT